MTRFVSSRLELVLQSPTELFLSVSVAAAYRSRTETLRVSGDEGDLSAEEMIDEHSNRIHRVLGQPGALSISYRAEINGLAEPEPVTTASTLQYFRPSRYCESDAILDDALTLFGTVPPAALPDTVLGWVHNNVKYDTFATVPGGGAIRTLETRVGVCRDFAHLSIAFLRALDIPARFVAVYAPELFPMDFHAVVEVLIDGQWRVYDPTGLAPWQSLVRIATGRDASDTAFLSNSGILELRQIEVNAWNDAGASEVDRTDRILR